MIELNLGVIEQPYADPAPPAPKRVAKPRKGRKTRGRKAPQARSTGDVAQILEAKYGIMEAFFTLHEPEIVGDLADAMAGAIENLVMGAPPTSEPWAGAASKIQGRFKEFIDTEEMAGLSGVPTKAALAGVSHRRKHPYARGNPRRASFVDTGLYEDSFVAWAEEH